jgi:hypothetical protein
VGQAQVAGRQLWLVAISVRLSARAGSCPASEKHAGNGGLRELVPKSIHGPRRPLPASEKHAGNGGLRELVPKSIHGPRRPLPASENRRTTEADASGSFPL